MLEVSSSLSSSCVRVLDLKRCTAHVTAASRSRRWQQAISTLRAAIATLQADVVLLNAMLQGLGGEKWRWTNQLLWYMRQSTVQPDLLTLTFATSSYTGNWALTVGLLSEVHGGRSLQRGVEPDTVFLNNALSCLRKGPWQGALQMHARMQRFGPQSDAFSFATIVSGTAKASSWVLAAQCLHTAGSSRNLVMLNSMLHACSRAYLWGKAIAMLQVMPEIMTEPDVISTNTALAACQRSHWDIALAACTRRDSFTATALAGACWQVALDLAVDTIGCNAVLEACASASAWQTALSLLDHMRRRGPRPSSASFGSALKALSEAPEAPGAWRRPLQFLQLGEQCGLQSPVLRSACGAALAVQWRRALSVSRLSGDDVAFASAELALVEAPWQHALHVVLLRAVQRGQRKDADTLSIRAFFSQSWWHAALHSFQRQDGSRGLLRGNAAMLAGFESARWTMALSQWVSMRRRQVQVDLVAHGSILSAYRKELQWRRCVDSLSWMPPEHGLRNAAMAACAQAGQQHTVPGLLRRLRKDRVKADVISYNTCISAYEKHTRWKQSLQLLDELFCSSIQPDGTTYDALLGTCRVWVQSLALLRERSGVSLQGANAALASQAPWGQQLQQLTKLRRASLRPDVITHKELISSFTRVGQWCYCQRGKAEAGSKFLTVPFLEFAQTARQDVAELVDQLQGSYPERLRALSTVVLETWPAESPHWRVAGSVLLPEDRFKQLVQEVKDASAEDLDPSSAAAVLRALCAVHGRTVPLLLDVIVKEHVRLAAKLPLEDCLSSVCRRCRRPPGHTN
ncbi:unnamed protein product [Effrenium voratum]|nr:unnamed protein product [Effrenium voratum]